ncbi:hypothetical protein ACP70R_049031 [Stipagrostis hirtigluma subsp. patula]
MAQIADLMDASVVLDAAHNELQLVCAYPYIINLDSLAHRAHRIRVVLWEAQMRWVTSFTTIREEADAVVQETPAIQKEAQSQSIIREWLMRVKDVACNIRAASRQLLLGGRSKDGCALIARMLPCLATTTPTFHDIKDELSALEEQYERFGYATTGLPVVTCTEEPSCRGQQHAIITDVPPGGERDDDKQRIIGIITQAERERETEAGTEPVMLPIFGAAGVGKTTLVKSVFRDPKFQNYAKAWVHAPEGGDLKKIYTCIRSQAFAGAQSSPLQDDYSIDDMKTHLADLLGGGNKKLLLVLDGLCLYKWHSLDVSSRTKGLYRLLCGIGRNLVVIMTTTCIEIAFYMCSTDITPYVLRWLSDDMCWAIIKGTSGFEARTAGNHQEAEAAERIGRAIAGKCGGLPLAAKALGRFLRSVDPQQWPGVVGGRKDIWNIEGGFSHDSHLPLHSITVFTQLKQAHHYLPSDDWFVFATCAFCFSKGRIISRDDLHCQWAALHCGADISFLLSIALLRKEDSNATGNEHGMLLKMDDLMHDFARYLLGDMLVVVHGRRNGATLLPDVNKSSNANFAVISNWDANEQLDLSSILPDGILALRFEDCREMKLRAGVFVFSSTKHLLLLDLSGCSLKKLPDSIGQLKLLCYLNAPGIKDRVLPLFLTGLSRLQFLSLRGSCLLADLTEAFGRLYGLQHLDLSACSGFRALPESFEKLRDLRHLDMSGCSCVGGITEALRCKDLRYLNLSHRCGYSAVEDWFHLKDLDKVLPELKNLRFLGLSSCLNPLCYTSPPDKCKEYLHRCIHSLVKLEHLDLSQNNFLEDLPESIGELEELRTLNLSGCFRLRSLPERIEELEELRTLNLSGCFRLRSLPERIEELEELRTLNLSGCPQFNPLPENVQQKLAKLQSQGSLTIITDDKVYHPCKAGSHQEQSQERSNIAGDDQAQGTARQHASFIHHPSAAEPEITEHPDQNQ